MSQSLETLTITHPRLKTLHTFWDLTRGSRRFPARADFAFKDLRQWLGHIALVDVVHKPPRFRIRLLGTRLVEYAGQDHTGQWIDECVTPENVDGALEPFRSCVELAAPVVRHTRYVNPRAIRSTLERLLLPCSSDQQTIDIIMGCTYIEVEPDEIR
jgi:hypothetical protein